MRKATMWLGTAGMTAILAAAAASAGVTIRPVALQGDSVPGGGRVFGSLSNYWPIINNAGQVGFIESAGFWVGTPGNLSLAVGNTDPVPGVSDPGARWNLDNFLLNDAGQIAFGAILSNVPTTTGYGVWAGGPGQLSLVARRGDVLPGLPPGNVFGDTSAEYMSYNAAGELVFWDNYQPSPGVTHSALWRWSSGTTSLIANTGDPIPGFPGYTFWLGPSPFPMINYAGEVVFFSQANGPNGESISGGYWIGVPPAISPALARGQGPGGVWGPHAPGTPAGTILNLGADQHLNQDGAIFFTGGIYGFVDGIPSPPLGVFHWHDGVLRTLAHGDTQAPGTPAGYEFTGFAISSVANGDRVLFYADAGPQETPQATHGVWLATGNALSLVLRSSQAAPGAPDGVTITNVDAYPHMNNFGQVALHARWAGPGVSSLNDEVIYIRDAQGVMHLALREGDLVEVHPGDFRPLFNIQSHGTGIDECAGRRRPFNDAGQLAFRADVGGLGNGVFILSLDMPCSGDLDNDGSVSLSDLAILLSNYGTVGSATASNGDLDGDLDVDLTDLSILLSRFGVICS